MKVFIILLFGLVNTTCFQSSKPSTNGDGKGGKPPRDLTSVLASSDSIEHPGKNRIEYLSFQSSSLHREWKYAIQFPSSYDAHPEKRYPVVYFLHGINGTERWFERNGFAAIVSRMRFRREIGEFFVVAPSGGDGFYINAKTGDRYEDAIVKDLVSYIDKTYRTINRPQERAIQGISMGGFGALAIAFKHPELFSSVAAHSAVLYVNPPQLNCDSQNTKNICRAEEAILGKTLDKRYFRSVNPIDLARSRGLAIKHSGLNIYFDIGDRDKYGFQKATEALSRTLSKFNITHEFQIYPGDHSQNYFLSAAPRSYSFLWDKFAKGLSE